MTMPIEDVEVIELDIAPRVIEVLIPGAQGPMGPPGPSGDGDTVPPEDYGAVGDGVADDTIAVKDALESGWLVRGRGLYAVTGAVKPDANTSKGVIKTRFKQLISTIPEPATCTISIGVPGVVTLVGHGRVAGRQIMFVSTGTLPTPLNEDDIFYVCADGSVTADTFRVALTPDGPAVTTSGSQSGVHTLISPNRTLWFADQPDGLIVERNDIDCNSDHVTGGMHVVRGDGHIWVERCDDVSIQRNRIHDGGPGFAVVLNTVSGELSHNIVEDMTFDLDTSPGEEIITGASITSCPDLLVEHNTMRDIHGTVADVATVFWTLGMLVGLSHRSKYLYNNFDNMTSGLALAGYNEDINIIGTIASRMGSSGIKATNNWRGITVAGSKIKECGLAGIHLSRREVEDFTFELEPHDASIHDNDIRDTGSNGEWALNESGPAGIIIDVVPMHLHHPQGVSIYDNTIADEQKATCTMTIATPCVVTMVAHGKEVGEKFTFPGTTGAFPTGITNDSTSTKSSSIEYYVTSETDDTFQFSDTLGGTPINTSGTQSGTHYCSKPTMKWGIRTFISGSSTPEKKNWAWNNRISGAKITPAAGIENLSITMGRVHFENVFSTDPATLDGYLEMSSPVYPQPELSAATPPTGVAYVGRGFNLTRTGRDVRLRVTISLAGTAGAKGTGGSGDIIITGDWPPCMSTIGADGFTRCQFITLSGGRTQIHAAMLFDSSEIKIVATGSGVAQAFVQHSEIADNSTFAIEITYAASE